MAKTGKSSKSGSGTGIAQKHLHSRISYLYQAAVYLDTVKLNADKDSPHKSEVANAGILESKQSESCSSLGNRLEDKNAVPEAGKGNSEMTDVQPLSQEAPKTSRGSSAQTHQLLTSMRSISQKSQIRLSPSLKRSVCRRCNGLLTLNSTSEIENMSRGGRKPWADVLVVKCCQCGYVKRYPVDIGGTATRHKKKQRTACVANAPHKNTDQMKARNKN